MITTVVMSYKYGHLAANCIESLLSQTRKPDKILFIDDGARDCFHLEKIYPEVQFVFRKENLGIVKGFNEALDMVETDKVMFIGADNWLESDAIEILDKVDADIVTYNIMVVGEFKDEIRNKAIDVTTKINGNWYWDRSCGHHGSMLYNTKLGKECRYDSPKGRTVEDMIIYDRMLNKGAKREHINVALLYYRRHRENFNNCK